MEGERPLDNVIQFPLRERALGARAEETMVMLERIEKVPPEKRSFLKEKFDTIVGNIAELWDDVGGTLTGDAELKSGIPVAATPMLMAYVANVGATINALTAGDSGPIFESAMADLDFTNSLTGPATAVTGTLLAWYLVAKAVRTLRGY